MAKLSPAQFRALTELIETGVTSAKANTLKALEGKYIDTGNTDYKISVRPEAYEAVGIERPSATVDEIQAELDTNPWDLASQFADHGDVGLSPEKIEEIFSPLDIVLPAGWNMSKRNRKVWEGLSQEEIEKDIMTRVPANRADKRYAKRHQNHNH